MHTHEFFDGKPMLNEYAIDTIAKASELLNRAGEGGGGLSTHEYNAAAIVNGRLDWLDGDYRRVLIAMGPDWAYGILAVIFKNWQREMTLRADHTDAPQGDQRIMKG